MVKLKYDVEVSEWDVITAGSEVELIDFDEYSGFTGIIHQGKKYYINTGYLVNVPVMN